MAAGAASAAGAAQSAGAAFPQALASAEQFASSVQQAQELTQPHTRLLSARARAVHELPESVKDQVRTRAEAILEETPPELKTYLKTQMETLLPQLPPKMREAFSSHVREEHPPAERLDVALVANLTDVERDALLATTKNVVTHSMRQALAKPEALVETLHKLVDSLPPEVRSPAPPDPRAPGPLPTPPPRAPVHRDDRVGADQDAAAGRGPPHLPPHAARLRTAHRALGERAGARCRAPPRLPPVVAGGGSRRREQQVRCRRCRALVQRENAVDW